MNDRDEPKHGDLDFPIFAGGLIVGLVVGGIIGGCSNDQAHKRDAIARGQAIYNPTNGNFQWNEPRRQTREPDAVLTITNASGTEKVISFPGRQTFRLVTNEVTIEFWKPQE